MVNQSGGLKVIFKAYINSCGGETGRFLVYYTALNITVLNVLHDDWTFVRLIDMETGLI